MLVPLVLRFRPTVRVWRNCLLVVACMTASAIFANAAALAQVPPIGATAEVRDAAGRLLAYAQFREGRGEVLTTLIFSSPPALTGTHGLRIMAVGRCDPPDFTTAGAGFNPLNKKHGRQNPDGPQVGDLPNVNFTNGLSSYNTSALGATLGPGPTSLLAPNRTALVIFSGDDDQVTDPDGKAGARIACGVITAAGGGAGVGVGVGGGVAAQPAVPTPVTSPPIGSPVVRLSPVVVVVVTQAVARPGASPVPPVAAAGASPTVFVPLIAVPTAAPAVAAAATQNNTSLGTGPALLIALLGVGLFSAGYLLRRRSLLGGR
jgi:Cu-Zn family superoxide dismutase